MLVIIPDLLNSTQVEAVCSVLRQSKFTNGRRNAGSDARVEKNNLELAVGEDSFDALNDVVMATLEQNPIYLQAASRR
ncbi:MAG: hypothetical protein GY896_13475 [Gammaproteobacteria bacterium]|nr:hypothetical protein [Gammaproteobacteria bacterium]